jgi:hypothetical protein
MDSNPPDTVFYQHFVQYVVHTKTHFLLRKIIYSNTHQVKLWKEQRKRLEVIEKSIQGKIG